MTASMVTASPSGRLGPDWVALEGIMATLGGHLATNTCLVIFQRLKWEFGKQQLGKTESRLQHLAPTCLALLSLSLPCIALPCPVWSCRFLFFLVLSERFA